MSCVLCHMPLFNQSKTVIITIPYVSCVLCHMSGATCHLWHVTYIVTQFLFQCFKNQLLELFGEGSAINRAYLFQFLEFFFLKLNDTHFLIIFASSGPFWGSIKKANWWQWNRLEVPNMVNLLTCGRGPMCTFLKDDLGK